MQIPADSTGEQKTHDQVDPVRISLMRLLLFAAFAFVSSAHAEALEYSLVPDVSYQESSDPYITERCKLDIYHPEESPGFATVVWFHGGALKSGKKFLPPELKEKGFAVVPVNYRLHPKVKCPAYIEDAAAAVAWVFKNIETYGGDPEKIFVAGHSAGGYLTNMIGLDKSYLAKHDIDADKIAALIPLSGNGVTHFTIRKENGIPREQVIVDRFAPIYHVRGDAPPMLLITGDRDLELLGRYEVNALLWRMMKVVKHPDIELLELDGFGHGSMVHPGCRLLAEYVQRATAPPKKTTQ